MSKPPEIRHTLLIDGREIIYHLRRSRRRTIGLGIDQRGLRVGAPQRARLGDIEALIRQHARWVFDKLDHWQARPPARPLDVHHGAVISFVGEPLTVGIDPARLRGHQLDPQQRLLTLNGRQAPSLALSRALQTEARQLLSARLAHYAAHLGVPPPPLRLSSAKTRWGSCNHRGGISLNWRLVFMPLPVIDYVVAHELAHLKEMNHSARFWSVVEVLCPDWQARRQELRRLSLTLPVL